MTTATMLLTVALVLAVVDWWGVWHERQQVVYLAKPLVLVVVIAAVLSMPDIPAGLRILTLAGLSCGLVGDIFLMRDKFIAGAAAFALGHLCYVAAWLPLIRPGIWLLASFVIFGLLLAALAPAIVRGARAKKPLLGKVVFGYQFLLLAMVVSAGGTEIGLLAMGAMLFGLSDAILGWSRFARDMPKMRVVVHITYHLGQVAIAAATPLVANLVVP